MFGQRLLLISFILLAFCQLYAHGAATNNNGTKDPEVKPPNGTDPVVKPDAPAPAPLEATTAAATTQYAAIPMMILSALPVYYML